ncbi:MAG TPA: DUF4097 family beta strand repeat-containing protein [Thermoanaerobaculia bacterium]|nr:DUF4097 family beta strand repeat-containing protein [Thermoanaerobaculia bacterium]
MSTRRFRIPGLAILALALTWTSATSLEAAETVKETFQKSYPLQSGGELSVENRNGGITVEAWDRNEVQVVAVKQVKAGSGEKAREAMKKIKIDVQSGAGAVRIATRLPKEGDGFFDWLSGDNINFSVTYKIKAPRQLVADLQSTNGGVRLVGTRGRADLQTTNGGVSVEKVEGNLRLRSTNGGLTVVDAAGTLDGVTTNGGIRAELTEVDGDISLRTTNGGVTLQLPRDLRASVDIATSNGGIHSDLEVEGGEKTRKSLTGDINGGGGKLYVRSTNGGVRIVTE